MVEIWYFVLCLTFAIFIIRDGWDFGAGAIHLWVARNEEERRQVFAAIGPLWSWNEVWLVATGGVMAMAFPRLMGIALSGFYLALFFVLWALLLRGIAIEVRGHIDEPLWKKFWDFLFAASNILLVLLLGVAAGNLVRGVPLDGTSEFSMPLFTNFRTTDKVGLLDWYTILIGLFSVAVFCAHGATYLVLKSEGGIHERGLRMSRRLWLTVLAAFPLVSWATWYVREDFYSSLASRAAGWLVFIVLMTGIVLLSRLFYRGETPRLETVKFAGACCVVAGLLGGIAVALFPHVLRSSIADSYSVSAYPKGANNADDTLGMLWWPLAFGLAMIYMFFVGRSYRGKAKTSQDTQGFY
jgi:cytochrome d ubiquinol oxidase subunit II